MTNKLMIKISAALLLALGIITILSVPNKAKSEHYTAEPTVFIHGYKGTANSFRHMLDRFENEYKWGKKGFVYFVSKEGQIRDYNLSKGKYAPTFIQIVLEDNRASFADSSEWISSVLLHMKEKYHIDSVNLVGHSMGGIMAVKYAMESEKNGYPKVNKLITIGSPFDGIYSEEYFQIHKDPAAADLKPDSLALQLLRKSPFPDDIEVLSIGSTGDIVALPESVQSLRNIIPNDNYHEIMIEDDSLGHSGLHENKEVDKMIHSFLWQDTGQ
ncbi:alpha/beta fold hydrolase [Oceanobacillus massiliensis]|uniref:alpha/beta fold hydrolase n=1 Tax=Oceanobacillus massiliensis TaxID=1465765 RepID=UPI000289B8C0|nr:alpha/beta fold hydrolase [Oceanobacillus massiliensis]